jgi:hypothetical protein
MATTVPLEQVELRRPGYGRSRHRAARLALVVVLVALVGLAAILASQTTREGVTVPAVPQIDEDTALRSLQVRGLVPAARYDPDTVATVRFTALGLIPTRLVSAPEPSSEDLATARLVTRGLLPDAEAVVTARLVNEGLVPAATLP